MKRFLTFALVLCLAAALAGCGGSGGGSGSGSDSSGATGGTSAKVFQVGFTTAAIEDDPYYVFAKNFSDLVDERTGGDVRIDLMGGGQIGQEREMFEGMQLGTVDMAVMTNAYASNFVPASGLFDLPFIFADNAIAAEILDGPIGQSVLGEYDAYGVKALAWGEGGFRHLVAISHPIRVPADFSGLKIRCMETNTYLATYEALGANAVPMAWAETITGLQQGTIDGLDIPISVTYANGFPEIANYLSLTGHFYSPLIMCISNDAWESLDAEQQEIVRQAAVEAGQKCREHNAKVEAEMLEEMAGQGMTIVDDVDIPAFQTTLADFYSQQSATIGGTYVEDLLAALGA